MPWDVRLASYGNTFVLASTDRVIGVGDRSRSKKRKKYDFKSKVIDLRLTETTIYLYNTLFH